MTYGGVRPRALRGAPPAGGPGSEDGRGIDPVVEAGDDDHPRGGHAEGDGDVVAGEQFVAFKKGGQSGHGASVRHLRPTTPLPAARIVDAVHINGQKWTLSTIANLTP